MKLKNVFNLPSGRIFLLETYDGYLVEATEMRDVATSGKLNVEVRSSDDPHVIWNHLVPYSEKWLMTVSTQRGCTHNCRFCDVAGLPFAGNLSYEDIMEQIRFILDATPYVKRSSKVKIGFARMGEPSHNLETVLKAIRSLPFVDVSYPPRHFRWLPCFNSILPAKTMEGLSGEEVVRRVMDVKENYYGGFLHFQISCNSTDEGKRRELFGGADVLPVKDVVSVINSLPCTARTVTLNFIVMQGVEVSPEKLMAMDLDPSRFTVKLIPLNATDNAKEHGLETYANYSTYDELERLADKFRSFGVPVVFDSIAKCEEAGLCCGQIARKFCDKKGV